MKATVLIPTKNPGALFRKVMEAVLSQETPWPYEVLVIDSGSTDGTVDYCRSLGEQVRVHTIAPQEFGHGRTRNLGISMAKGEFVALITHDALPASSAWLRNLVGAADQAPDVAGAFGRHLPYPGCNPFVARDLQLHFDHFLTWPLVARLEDRDRYQREAGYRQVLHFFSDNNACVRRSVWEKYPYPDVDFAEDQIWAKQIIEAGYGKAYADDAAVYHSHNYSIVEYGRRSFDESKALRSLFGYQLCPSFVHLVGHFVRSTLADWRYAKQTRLFRQAPAWPLRSPFLNLARQLGYYLGERADRLPRRLVATISLDQSLKRRA
ncbi:glycosyltransferase family 2 protein [Geitlerinema sp. PCC 7407]|uniref:glycosyltransferase family 2 protein n=1 Tax=Geitlerinema sp. PCC 7407 TaxID=1173025 RepID=UPI00029F8B14|nr:glycosyltransferase family 2 protein [Geitlerinema sp. PCC 7407]AFY64820.1 glycosyl transferase family 2 [Geitlerinema sp. PCC 7407]